MITSKKGVLIPPIVFKELCAFLKKHPELSDEQIKNMPVVIQSEKAFGYMDVPSYEIYWEQKNKTGIHPMDNHPWVTHLKDILIPREDIEKYMIERQT